MSDVMVGALTMLGCVVLIQTGMHIAVALMFLSFAGVFTMKGMEVAGKLLARSAATSIASDAYGVIPLFVLMGLFVSATAMGRDTFDVAALVLKRLRGGLAMATVGANAVFAACTGTSIASASIFTKIAVPEMVRHGHTTGFSVGVVAGSSVLGMLIPPSILFIIFGVIANVSIGDLFTSGILPGIVLSIAFCITISLLCYLRAGFVFVEPDTMHGEYKGPFEGRPAWYVAWKFMPICLLIGIVLGGIYGGFFTPIEAGGAGALAAFLIALFRRELTAGIFWEVALETGRVTAAICFLLMAAQMYSQMLTLSGLPYAVGQWLLSSGLSFIVILIGYLIVVLIMGCFLDSVSIMLILLPFVLPVMDGFSVNFVWFGVITVIAIEVGLLTPPLGVSVFVVKANLDDQSITTWQVFKGAAPMTLTMCGVLVICVLFPWLSLVLIGQKWTWW